eukprot:9021850-Pyramimonas_sp.AAC.1
MVATRKRKLRKSNREQRRIRRKDSLILHWLVPCEPRAMIPQRAMNAARPSEPFCETPWIMSDPSAEIPRDSVELSLIHI